MEKVALLGATGIVGEAILEIFLQEAYDTFEIITFSNRELAVEFEKLKKSYVFPLTDFKQLRKKLLEEKPKVIINAVGVSDKDYAEDNKQITWKINVQLVEHLVSLSKILNAHFITFSCEDIFDGKSGPYSEIDKPNPQNYLGKTKLAAENFVISNLNNYSIIRLPLVYGVSAHGKKDFVAKVIDMIKKTKEFHFDEIRYTNPVLSEDVALGVLKMVERELTGIFHFGGFDYLNWHSFSLKIIKFFNLKISDELIDKTSKINFFGLKQSYSEALLSMRFSSISEGLITYKYLDREEGSDFEKLMNY